MEKRSPHCHAAVESKYWSKQARCERRRRREPGRLRWGSVTPICWPWCLALKPADFYKSMTTYADQTIWQDVYRPKTSAGDVYLKLTVIDDVLIVSFKELYD